MRHSSMEFGLPAARRQRKALAVKSLFSAFSLGIVAGFSAIAAEPARTRADTLGIDGIYKGTMGMQLDIKKGQEFKAPAQLVLVPAGDEALLSAQHPTGVVVGTVTFGAGNPPPPATDPDAAYPPGASQLSPVTIAEGFPYTMARGTLEASRLRFTIWETELWSGWCALQPPFPGSPSCLPIPGMFSYNTDGTCSYQAASASHPTAVDCTKMALCNAGVCACTDGACAASIYGSIEFDMALSVNGADGSITGQIGDHNIRLTQSP